MLLQLDERRLAGYGGGAAVQVLGRVRRIRCVHPGMWCSRGALVRAPQIRKIKRVGADSGHFFQMYGGAGFIPSHTLLLKSINSTDTLLHNANTNLYISPVCNRRVALLSRLRASVIIRIR